MLRDELHRQRVALTDVATRHGASNVRIFGSVARGEERPDSDIDLLIDFAPNRGFGDYLALIEELEYLLARRVDIVIERSLSPHFRPFIEAEAQPL
ncbi:MAG TPA: nucleotidyltransferase family protein [Stellaceae bacterium]